MVHDMDHQEKYKAQQRNTFFPDGRAMRLPVPGTVARGHLRDDDHYHRGMVDGKFADTFPARFVVDRDLLEKGRERYEIFCATCHGFDGSGRGPTAVRAQEPKVIEDGVWVPIPDYIEDRVRERPLGHLFHTITHGYPHESERNMQPYGPQVPTAHRWAVVAYVRALILSRTAAKEDIPPEILEGLESGGGR